ncbi:hypothetical protein [Pelovirga terrestris]|nr:hypothetical protein [Pelovirga terrestris]
MKKVCGLIAVAIVGVVFVFTAGSFAERVNPGEDFRYARRTEAYINAQPMFEILYRMALEQDKKFGLQPHCNSQYQVKPLGTIILSPINFPDDRPHPTEGIWNYRYQIERCGEAKIYNTLFIATDNGEAPTPRIYYPGTTSADPLLIKDAMLSALVVATATDPHLKDCREIDVFDMQVTKAPHTVTEENRGVSGGWSEDWTFRMCGQLATVGITFTPDQKNGGTTFSINPSKSGVGG